MRSRPILFCVGLLNMTRRRITAPAKVLGSASGRVCDVRPSIGVAVLAVAALAAACASHPRVGECTASEEVVDAYLTNIMNRASDEMSSTSLARYEQVTLSVAIEADGTVSDVRVLSASTPAAADEGKRAVLATAPYSPPPFDPRACLFVGRAEFSIHSSGRCDDALAERYTDDVTERVMQAVDASGIDQQYPGQVVLRIDIATTGAVKAVKIQRAESREAGKKIAALARALPPFEPPGDAIRECVADSPLLIWIDLPGPPSK